MRRLTRSPLLGGRGAGGGRGLVGPVAPDLRERGADFGHLEPVLLPAVPVLRHVVGRHLVLINETVERRARDAKFLSNDFRGNQRFLLTHSLSLSQPCCLPVLDSGTMRQLESSTEGQSMDERKREWQRRKRAAFAAEHGYSTTANYGAGGQRQRILERDGLQCVRCGMTDAEHQARWDRPITVDHISKDRSDNSDGNLQTLCLSCHGRKDITPSLIVPRVPEHRSEIEARRASGQTYQRIADDLGFSIAAIWKWVRRWEQAS